MDMKHFSQYVNNAMRENPAKAEQIFDFYELALTEIEAGESEQNEIELAINSIKELINDKENEE